MIDIWGRPLSAAEKPTTGTQTTDDVKKIIEDEIAETLNLASVDPGEIVVFQDKQGKLKTSNVSLDDILIRRRDAADNTIALFQDGKLKPGVLVSTVVDAQKNLRDAVNDHIVKFNELQKDITDSIKTPINNFFGVPRQQFDVQLAHVKAAIDNLAKLRTDYDTHVATFVALKKNFNRTDNAIDKFFGKNNIKPEEIKTTLDNITTNQQKSTDDITDIYSRLGVFNEDRSISDLIAINKKSIEDIKAITDAVKDDFSKITPKLDKIKIPHERFSNIVYTKKSGTFEWTPENDSMYINAIVKGIYRLTLVSEFQFKISSLTLSSSVNNLIVVVIKKDETRPITITSTDSSVENATITWCMEFVAELE